MISSISLLLSHTRQASGTSAIIKKGQNCFQERPLKVAPNWPVQTILSTHQSKVQSYTLEPTVTPTTTAE